ncbi:MAG TPA: thioredoxin domain-containing protein [Vicinamibacterales bacterium]|nr:thioredoxin domain-containing protein [Vicinamibacterales bacterium]
MNRLGAEQSPYLLQHAANPVDWYPWRTDAFDRARREDKPIFLSIGYSTCHWCHVMEHESFESGEIAAILNRDFVSIKVDREERPDVDRVYMTFVQATTGSGGWPMSVWLTPELKPFYGGTYYPPQSQWGRPGFAEVLAEISRAWRDDRATVLQSAHQITERLADIAGGEGSTRRADDGATPPPFDGVAALSSTVRQFRSSFDSERGGFGDAPKFPRPSELLFLLREHARTSDAAPRDMVLTTLRAMALGGMRDHVGGGFHRYSVDGNWRVPHFEKMLYDQSQLVLAYLEAAQVSGDPFFAQIAEDTLQYVARELTDRGGGFFSAEDADSIPAEAADQPEPRKMEGAFYIWSVGEVRALLGDDAVVFEMRYGLLPEGNAPFDPHAEFTGKNLLYTAQGISAIATTLSRSPEDVAAALTRARVAIFAAQRKRPRPSLDDKILTGWNGLMIAAFARAGRVLGGGVALGQDVGGDPGVRHLETAQRAAAFLKATMWQPDRRVLLRRYRGGDAAIQGYAEDYAFLIFGLLELFQADGDPQWLEWAVSLQRAQDDQFWDAADGGWFSTTGNDPSVLVRMKEEYDGAEPSASGVGAHNLLVLAHLTGEMRYDARAREVFTGFGARLSTHGRTVPMMSAALSFAQAAPEQIIVVGSPSDATTRELWQAAQVPYKPFATTVPVAPGERQQQLAAMMPWLGAMTACGGGAAYICRNFVCEAPVTSAHELVL